MSLWKRRPLEKETGIRKSDSFASDHQFSLYRPLQIDLLRPK